MTMPASPVRLPGFEYQRIDVDGVLINCAFQLVGHDRGARAGHRLAPDYPGAVTRFAVLDVVPTQYALRNLTLATVTANYQWFFLSTGRGIPEHMIAADPGFWVREQTAQLIGAGTSIEPEVMADYIRCFRDQRAIAAVCADFRASPGPDLAHDEQSIAAGQKVQCPSWCYGAPKGRSARATTRRASGRRTRPMSAASPCPPATSSPRKHHAWSLTPCRSSSISAQPFRPR
jgi:pimeloyl-ACP methyl ester carboxylesterase